MLFFIFSSLLLFLPPCISATLPSHCLAPPCHSSIALRPLSRNSCRLQLYASFLCSLLVRYRYSFTPSPVPLNAEGYLACCLQLGAFTSLHESQLLHLSSSLPLHRVDSYIVMCAHWPSYMENMFCCLDVCMHRMWGLEIHVFLFFFFARYIAVGKRKWHVRLFFYIAVSDVCMCVPLGLSVKERVEVYTELLYIRYSIPTARF